MDDTVYLILQNGSVFEGKRFGAAADTVGELVFTTAMTGYIETLTDPSYYGQIVLQTSATWESSLRILKAKRRRFAAILSGTGVRRPRIFAVRGSLTPF